MITRRRAGIAVAIVTSLGLAAVATAELATTRVSYLAGGSVYVEAGRLDGLAEGDTLQVVTNGRPVARLIVRFLSSRRAVCDTLKVSAMPAVGDPVRYQARRSVSNRAVPGSAAGPDSAASASAALPASPAPTAGDGRRRGGVRGRIGARALMVSAPGGSGYWQPALDLRLDGTNLGGAPVDLAVDVRLREVLHRDAAVPNDGAARVYRMAATLHDRPGRRRVTVGRQLTWGLVPVSLFDGALIEYSGERWGAGLLSGAQPDPESWRVSGDVLQHGAFVIRRGRQGPRRWSVTAGGVAAFDRGQMDRQFGFVTGTYLDPRLALSLTEEVDLNTGWKRGTGEPLVSPTSTFLSGRAQVSRRVSINAGYDNRRNVRLYRDRLTPEIAFDDSHRQGAWIGSAAEMAGHLWISADARWSGGGPAGDYRSWSASGEVRRLPALQADVRWRSTSFGGGNSRGWMHVVGLAVRPLGTARVELSGGARDSRDVISQLHTHARWEGLDVDMGLGPRWYLLLSAQRDHEAGFEALQAQAGLSWLF